MAICPVCEQEVPENEAISYAGAHEDCYTQTHSSFQTDSKNPLPKAMRMLRSHAPRAGGVKADENAGTIKRSD